MIWWTGLAPWEFEFPFPGSLISTFLVPHQNTVTVRFKGIRIREMFQRFRGGLVFKAHRLVNHSTLGWRVIKKKKKK